MTFPGTITLPFVFSGGLNSKVSDFSLEQPYLATLKNGRYNQYGQIDKRTGFTAISNNIQGGGNISSGFNITTFNNELVQLDGESLYSYQPEEQVWIPKGAAFATTTKQYRILNTKVFTQNNPDVTTSNNISLYAWEDNRSSPANGSGIRYSVVNNQTNNYIVSDQLIYNVGSRPKVVTDNTNFYVLFNGSSDHIFYSTIPILRPNTITSQFNAVCTDGNPSTPVTSTIPYDATIFNGSLLVVYGAQGPAFEFHNNHQKISVSSTINVIGACVDSKNQVWICYSDNSNTYIAAYTFNGTSWTAALSPMVLESLPAKTIGIIEDINSGTANVTCEFVATNGTHYINNYTAQINKTITFIGQSRSVGLASKPFKQDNNIFINTIYSSTLQATYFTQCLTKGFDFTIGTTLIQSITNSELATDFNIISKHSPQNGGTFRTNTLLSQADSFSTNAFLFAGQRKGAFTSFSNAQTVNLGVAGYSIIFNTADTFNNVTTNNNLHLVGGVKKVYDGISLVEDNFHVFPENSDGYGCTITLQTGGKLTYNPLTQPNQYQYLVVYEWADNYGQVQRSGPSLANTVITTAVGQGTALTGPMLRLTDKVNPRTPVSIAIYRTQDSLPIFYKITDDNNPIINDPTMDFWTFTDNQSDIDIAANENLYTGSQLPNTAPPPCSLISILQERLVINNNEDPNTIWYSQNKFDLTQYNTLALDWNTSFVQGIDNRFGADGVTAIGSLDNNLVIFKRSSIFMLEGDGPNPLNTAGQFNNANPIVADTGCTNQNSLCFITQTPKLPGGLLFKSAKGIYLLGRDKSLYYIGAPVEKYNYLTITSANLLTKTNEVVFTSLEGICLVYNYFFDAWSTWENLPAVQATVWMDQLVILHPNGTAMVQDITGTVYADTFANNVVSPVQMQIKLPWVKLGANGNLQGRACVYNCLILGTLQAPHVLQIDVSYDYNDSVLESDLINSSLAANRWGSNPIWGNPGIWGQYQFANYQFQKNFQYPRGFYGAGCESIQLTLTDLNPNSNQGYSLNGLVFEVMPLPSTYVVPSGNLIGAP